MVSLMRNRGFKYSQATIGRDIFFENLNFGEVNLPSCELKKQAQSTYHSAR
jgi:hypothetical protein